MTESGLHGGLTQTRGSDRDGKLGAFGFRSSHIGFGHEKLVAVRVVNIASLAFGSTGVEGGLSNAFAGGLRLPITARQGIVLRGGIEGTFFGNKYLWDSQLELPQLHVAYQWLAPGKVFDLAAKGGYILLGRHNTGDAAVRDTDGSLEWGALADGHLGPVDLHATWTRIRPRHGGSPVNQIEGAFCGNAGRVTLCTDLRYEVGDVRLLDGSFRDATVTTVGLTFGYVLFDKKPEKRPPAK
ncbi:MAG: hypothetical protein JWP97_6614 [Labilithrix sp.]|nr:hypothetical protein [Labilithrix sp.]